jgi:hypothetical protein
MNHHILSAKIPSYITPYQDVMHYKIHPVTFLFLIFLRKFNLVSFFNALFKEAHFTMLKFRSRQCIKIKIMAVAED